MKAIFAIDSAGGMGKDGKLPWPRMQGDLAHFARLTTGGTVIMGRGTYESSDMPCPLPNRKNVVLSKTLPRVKPGMALCRSVADLEAYGADAWVIGGAGVLRELWPRITEAYVTLVHGEFAADAVFDQSLLDELEQVSTETSSKDFTIKHFKRKCTNT